MIPCKLQVKNFLSYGETQTIDFTPYKLICLSGKNGHGKSALLDAITWALWGQARKTTGSSKADHGLLRLGQTNMMVVFDFILNSQLYRVKREYAYSYGKPHATVEFGTLNTDGSFIPLTDKTIRSTQAAIEETLHLDFAAFTNSAFLRQGQSNEFSKKSPKERKEIIASILGLDQYETIRKLAMEKIKHAQQEKATLGALQESILRELSQEEEINKQLTQVTAQLTQVQTQEKKYTQEQDILLKKNNQLAELKKEQEMVQFHINQLVAETNKQQEQLRSIRTLWHTTHTKLLTGIDHRALEQTKATLVQQINAHQKTRQLHLEYKEQILTAQATLQQLHQKHMHEHTQQMQKHNIEIERAQMELTICAQKNKELTQQIQQYTQEHAQLEQAFKKLIHTQQTYSSQLAHVQKQEEQFIKRRTAYNQFVNQGNWLKEQLLSLEQKQQLAHDEQDPSCPLCEQNLSASRRRFLKDKFTKQESFLRHQLARITRIIPQLKQTLFEQHEQLAQIKKIQETYTQQTVKIDELEKQKIKLTTMRIDAEQQLATLQKKEAELHKSMQQMQQAREQLDKQQASNLHAQPEHQQITKQITELDHTLKKHIYNATAHQKTHDELLTLDKKLQEYEQLKAEQSQQEHRKIMIAQLCATLKQYKQQQTELQKKHAQYNHLQQEALALHATEKELAHKSAELRSQKDALLQQKGSLENQQKKIDQLKTEQTKQTKQLVQLQEFINDYQTIATATSKDGIQALLIEDAIPEIEQEANELLARLTNNQAQVFIESLRDLKSGGTKETLDIKISDAAGIRPYEMFSGGEAFRIDFALRIAISKLLARRAGTALQTLIIDEGFGALDDEGLSNIMDAIHAIQDDFNKVIIVSHLPMMKDQFPVHFYVDKQPNGSHISIIENG